MLARIGWRLIVVPLYGYTIHLDLHLAMLDLDLALVDIAGLPYAFLGELQPNGGGVHCSTMELFREPAR